MLTMHNNKTTIQLLLLLIYFIILLTFFLKIFTHRLISLELLLFEYFNNFLNTTLSQILL